MIKELSPKRRRFVKEVIASSGSATEAAIKAGYSPKSAAVIASRLMHDPQIKSELALYFVDQEKELSASLQAVMTRLRKIIDTGGSNMFLRAAKLLIEYTKLTTSILGLDIKAKSKSDQPETASNMSLEALLERTESEAARIRELILQRSSQRPPVS